MISDRDRISTRQLNRLRRRILRVYGTARREMQEQLTEFLAKYKALDERKRAQLAAGEITEDDLRDGEEQLQKITDDYVKQAETAAKKKEQEVLSI